MMHAWLLCQTATAILAVFCKPNGRSRKSYSAILCRSTQAEHDALERAIVMADVGDGAGATGEEHNALDDVDVSALDIDSLVACG